MKICNLKRNFTPLVLIFAIMFFTACKEKQAKTEKTAVTTAIAAELYTEKFRPQFHFSPQEKWMNDPNGMVYYKGKYHLFYQYYPEDIVWGPMHWGHAVSTDLHHWEHLPIALYPDEHGLIFSGSAVIDFDNTSGFGTKENPAMVAIYTYHDMEGEQAGRTDFQTQGIAYSLDEGLNWTKYEGNPVIPNQGVKDFRDPKVFWHEASKKWIMTLVAGDCAQFYASKDLKKWEHLSDFGKDNGAHGGVWECPDLIPLQVKGSEEVKWALLISINPGAPNGGSGTQYFIGDFDGKRFTTSQKENKWVDLGRDNYAGVTYNNTPEKEAIFIGWMSNWDYARDTPTERWRSAMTLPRKLALKTINKDYVLSSYPLEGFDSLLTVSPKTDIEVEDITSLKHDNFNQTEIRFTTDTKDLSLSFSNTVGDNLPMLMEGKTALFSCDRGASGEVDFKENFADKTMEMSVKNLPNEIYEWRIILDHSSMEVFLNKGQYVMTNQIFPKENYTSLQIENSSQKKSILLKDFQINDVKSIW